MLQLINKTIEGLKVRVKNNLELINENQKEIKVILEKQDSPEKRLEFDKLFNKNKELLAQNNDYINIQLTLINFVEKYKTTSVLQEDSSVVDIYSITDEKEIFELTKKGVLPFNEAHPKFEDSTFIDKLIQHYGQEEDYEKCQELVELKNRFAMD